jgi:hypothetical protein
MQVSRTFQIFNNGISSREMELSMHVDNDYDGVVGAAKSLAEAIVINRRLRCVALNEKSPHSLTIDQLSQDILSHQAAKHFDF